MKKVDPIQISNLPLKEWAKSKSRLLVLGKYPDYIKLAKSLEEKEISLDYFYLPSREWDSLSRNDRWKRNKDFISEKIRNSKCVIIISNYISSLDEVDGQLRDELDYLVELGYHIEDGFKVVK
ncbi:MAG TPA: hypothetical protein DIU37_06700 [Opitutae bacterium]|nr:hypothetical protein [Opitutae bacterium]|tara:strand:- start:81 stop:449 length:369 start_codon:yes stop_codon:yes gene_type:complete